MRLPSPAPMYQTSSSRLSYFALRKLSRTKFLSARVIAALVSGQIVRFVPSLAALTVSLSLYQFLTDVVPSTGRGAVDLIMRIDFAIAALSG